MSKKISQDVQSKREFRKICEYAVSYGFCYCYLCGQPITPDQKWNLDHVRCKSKGGKTEPSNLRPVHYQCNQDKADMPLGMYRLKQLLTQNKGKTR